MVKHNNHSGALVEYEELLHSINLAYQTCFNVCYRQTSTLDQGDTGMQMCVIIALHIILPLTYIM